MLKIFGSNRGCSISARTCRHHVANLHLLIKCLVTKLKTNRNVRQVLLRVNCTEKWTGMKNTALKMAEKDQIYVAVGFSYYQNQSISKLEARVLVFSVLNVSELIRGLTRARNLKKQCIYMQGIFVKIHF